MNRPNYEMATPINALQQPSNINNLVKNVENNIETLGNTTNNIPTSQPVNLTYNPNVDVNVGQQYSQLQQPVVNSYQHRPQVVKQQQVEAELPRVVEEKKSWYTTLLVNSKEYMIMVLLFALLAHKKVNRLFLAYIPGLANFDSPIPSLIIRGVLFTVLSLFIKNLV